MMFRLAKSLTLVVILLWAAGALLPGARAGLADLTPASAGSLPHTARGTLRPALDGLILVAPQAGRFQPAVADGVGVNAGTVLASVQSTDARHLGQAATAMLAAADTASLVASRAGTVVWRTPWGPAPPAGQFVGPGEALGVLLPPGRTLWTFPAALAPGTRVEIAPLGVAGTVIRGQAGAVELATPTTAAPVAVPATLAWGSIQGTLLPAAAIVRHDGRDWVLATQRWGGHLIWQTVTVLTAYQGEVAVTGLQAGALVASRPWLGGLWAVLR